MRKRSKLLICLGLLLVLAGGVLLLGTRFQTQKAREISAELLTALDKLLPERTPGVLEEYTETKMPVLQVEGRDLVAVLEIPGFGVTLPVEDNWEDTGFRLLPRRFSGSVYDGSLVIGGSDREGQLACLKGLQPGDSIMVTDMTGACFSYTVDTVRRSDSADGAVLSDEGWELTLFVRDSYNLEYILVRCRGGSG